MTSAPAPESPSDRLRRYAALARAVSSALKLDDALQQVTSAVASVCGGALCTIRLVEPLAGGHRLVAYAGGSPDGLHPVVPFGVGLTDVVARTRQALLVPDLSRDPRAADPAWANARGHTAYYGLPLAIGDELLGTLAVFFPTAPHAEEQVLVDLLAAQAVVAIHNARQFEEIERRRQAAESLAAVGRLLSQSLDPAEVGRRIVDSIPVLLGVRFARLLRLDAETGALHTVAVTGTLPPAVGPTLVLSRGMSAPGLAVLEGRPIVTRDVLDDARLTLTPELRAAFAPAPFRALLAVPLMARGRVVGALSAGAELGRVFEAGEVALMQAFADQAAVAIENARLHAEMTRSEARHRAVVEDQIELVARRRPDGTLTFVNEAYCAFFGHTREALVGTRFRPDVLDEEGSTPEAESPRGSGSATGRLQTVEQRVRVPDGEVRWVQWSDRAIVDERGTPGEVQSVGRDVTEHRRLEQQVLLSRKMEAVGQLAAGLAHDVNNLLAIVMGRSHLLRDELGPADPRHRQAEEIAVAADQLASLTRQLLAFGRRQVLRPVPLDLGAVLADLQPMLRRVVPEDIDLRIRTSTHGTHGTLDAVGDVGGRVTFDPPQLEEVVLKLVLNAREAMPRGGRLDLETATVVLDEGQARDLELAPGGYAVLTVRDDGVGMDRDTRERLFEPFFTTKARGAAKGSGLGLAVVYGVVKQSGGHITVASAPGRGTEVAVYLPLSAEGRRS